MRSRLACILLLSGGVDAWFRTKAARIQRLPAALRVRGGNYSDRPQPLAQPYSAQQQQQPYDPLEAPPGQQQSNQDRINEWKRQQEQYATEMGETNQSVLRDPQGRVKLMASVSKGSRAMIFFILMWRDVHLYEVADQTLKGLLRIIVVVPLCLLFISNMAGVVASLTSPSHGAKKRLKAILNLDKLVEMMLIVWNFFRLTIFPAKNMPREIFIANVMHSVFFLIQSQAFTRVNWDQMTAAPMGGVGDSQPPGVDSYGNSSSYRDKADANYEQRRYVDGAQQHQPRY